MKFNPKLKAEVLAFMEYVILVEGKKDVKLLNELGFEHVYALHETGINLVERIEQIKGELPKRGTKVCILTDFDKRGKKLYFEVKALCKTFGIKTDSTLRGLLLVGGLNHIEKLPEFMAKAQDDSKVKRKHWERR
jgi:5S rRNA maturation endonuclease (ribonuclease M5)